MIKEFKTFVLRGNIVDLATGVIIGAAFGKIVTSLVEDIIMPPIGLAISNVKFEDLKQVIGGTAEAPVTINYGNFIQVVLQFSIIAFSLFLILKSVSRFVKKEVIVVATPTPSKEEILLTQIRDILSNKS